ncbi:MAG: adenylate cyclase [Ktedonobacteraceae bacterium]
MTQQEEQLQENVSVPIPDQHQADAVISDAAAPSATRPRLSDEQLQQLLALIKGADSVELKVTVPETDQRSAVLALGMDPLEAQIRQVYFFDTTSLSLNQQGVVVRARRVQLKGDDSVVKLRPVVPSELPADLRKSPNFVVEVDAMPGGFVCSASLKGKLGMTDVKDAVTGRLALRKLFSKEQRAFYAAHAPEGIELEDLAILGPILVLKLPSSPKGFKRRLVAEVWLYPDGTRILELSTKCKPAEAFQVDAETRAFLSSRGVNLSGEQQTKTRTALDYFSKVLR